MNLEALDQAGLQALGVQFFWLPLLIFLLQKDFAGAPSDGVGVDVRLLTGLLRIFSDGLFFAERVNQFVQCL